MTDPIYLFLSVVDLQNYVEDKFDITSTVPFSTLGYNMLEFGSCCVRRQQFFKHLFLLYINQRANLDHIWQECSLGGPL